MAAPTVRGFSTVTKATDAVPAVAISLPTRAAGDLLLCFGGVDAATAGTPTGTWVELRDAVGTQNNLVIYGRIATNDANDNLSIAAANSQDFVAVVVAITVGTHGVTQANMATTVIIPANASGNSAAADPPSANGGSAKDWRAFAVAVVDLTATGSAITAAPTNYTTGAVLDKSAASTSSVAIGVGHRGLTAATTEDPGAFTNSSGQWLATTVLVPPPSPPEGTVSGSVTWGAGVVDGVAPSTGGEPGIIGHNGVGSSSAATADNWNIEATVATGKRYVAEEGDVVTKVLVYGDGTGDCEVGLYVYSGGVPTTRVATTSVTIGATAGWHQQTVSWALTAGVEYVIAADFYQTASWNCRFTTVGGTQTSIHGSTGPLPATWTQGSTSGDITSYYAEVTHAAGTPEGTVDGAVGWGAGSVTGVRTPKGAVSGAVGWVGTVNGVAPAGTNDGSVEGAISWAGSVTGVRTPKGDVSGAVSWVGTVDGVAPSAGGDISYTKLLQQRVISHGNTGGSGDYTSNAFTTTAGTLLMAIIGIDNQSIGGSSTLEAADIPLPATSGLTWVKVTGASTDNSRLWSVRDHIYIANNPTGGSKTIAQSGSAGTWDQDVNCIDVVILEFTNAEAVANQSGAVAAVMTPQDSANDPAASTLTLSGSPLSTSITVAAVSRDTPSVSAVTPGAGWAEEYDAVANPAGPFGAMQVQVRAAGSTSSSVAWLDLDAGNNAQIFDYSRVAMEVLQATGGAGPNEGAVSGSITWGSGSVTGTAPTGSSEGSVTGAITWGPGAVYSVAFPIPTSISGRFILDQLGNPYHIRTMSSWVMAYTLTNAQITQALEDVVENHFNGVTCWMGGAEVRGTGIIQYENENGDNFWTGTPWASSLGPAWDTVDWILDEALRLGIVVQFSFCGGFADFGCGPDWAAVTNADMYNAGVAIATRYINYPNIVWHIMFDDTIGPGATRGQRIDALFDGINDTETTSKRPVRWMEPGNGDSMSTRGWYDPTGSSTNFRGSINCGYSYTDNSAELIEGVWGEVSGPVGDCEPLYIGNAGGLSQPQNWRERSYTVFIEGGCIINWGHEDFWPMGAPNPFSYTHGETWDTVVTDPQTIEARYCWDLMEQYVADLTWVPTSFINSGELTGGSKAASGHSDTAALIYTPTNRSMVVNTTVLAGTANVRIRRMDPTTGAFTTIATSEAQNASRSLSNPGTNANGDGDWVYIIDLATESNGSIVAGSITWEGTVTGTKDPEGSVSGAVTWGAGSVTGVRTPEGSVSGSISWIGTVTGERDPKGDVSGSITWGAGVVVGAELGVVIGAITWTGSVTGERDSVGSVSGSVGWAGTVNGVAPAVGVNDGSVSGEINWVGSVTGVRTPKGSVSGAIGWVGSVTGAAPSVGASEGNVIGAISWVGSVTGVKVPKGAISGAVQWTGSVQGIVSGIVFALIVGDMIDGPGIYTPTFDGPAVSRALDGPNVARIADGPDTNTEDLDGPNRTTYVVDGPNTSRILDGPGAYRVVEGPET